MKLIYYIPHQILKDKMVPEKHLSIIRLYIRDLKKQITFPWKNFQLVLKWNKFGSTS